MTPVCERQHDSTFSNRHTAITQRLVIRKCLFVPPHVGTDYEILQSINADFSCKPKTVASCNFVLIRGLLGPIALG